MSKIYSIYSADYDPNLIYHYTTLETLLEYILPFSTIKFGSLKKTNDPLEFENFQIGVSLQAADGDFSLMKDLDSVSELARAIKNECKLACFSEDSRKRSGQKNIRFSKGYCLPGMWAHYGQKHYGCCLVFDKESLLEKLKKETQLFGTKPGTRYRSYSRSVNYNDNLPGLEKALQLDATQISSMTSEVMIRRNLVPLLFTKFENYRFENEFRIILHSKDFTNVDGVELPYENSLKAIILGSRFKMTYLPSILGNVGEKEVEIFRMSWFNGQPEIGRVKKNAAVQH